MITVLVADPPWQFADANSNGQRGAEHKYRCMRLDRIMAHPIPVITGPAVLLLWRCAAMQLEALQVAIAWGFVTKADLVWQKLTKNGRPHFGTGRYFRGSTETCILATRGTPYPAVRDQRNTFSARCPVDAHGRVIHSAKPDEFFEIVERLWPTARKIELFARKRRDGWEQHGRQLPKLKPCNPLEHVWAATMFVGQLRCDKCKTWTPAPPELRC